ncbi:DUF3180 domain-containing protein [Corynebacterium crudilactis]|uniref:DUF3180 domain-containing protein n=1 Tax=Corynebacterium crudilactis TaxID=1652495 RepID=A0A172QW63_9CORY|nr:DUF3180 domain-containing protein [Corynebacterium crudilactis]ANE04868.1 hypothetical protein ccrud_12120 [Corynebacterium crudilactis]
MQKTSPGWLIATGGFLAAVSAILTWRFYGSMSTIPLTVSITFWLLAVVCGVAGVKIQGRVDEGLIGQDKTQMNPMTIAFLAMLGRACAWGGAIFGGIYIGISSFVIPRAGELSAASADLPGVIACALGGIALSAAGVYLEKSCEAPPPQSGETIS